MSSKSVSSIMKLRSVNEVVDAGAADDPVCVIGLLERAQAGFLLHHMPSCERRQNALNLGFNERLDLLKPAASLAGRLVLIEGNPAARADGALQIRVVRIEALRRPWMFDRAIEALPHDIQFSLLAAADPMRAVEDAFETHTGINLSRLRTLCRGPSGDEFFAYQLAWLDRQVGRLFDLTPPEFFIWAQRQDPERFGIHAGAHRDGWCIEARGLAWGVMLRSEGKVLRIEFVCHSPEMAHSVAVGAALSGALRRNLALARWEGRDEDKDPRLFFQLGRQAFESFREARDYASAEQVCSLLVSQLADFEGLQTECVLSLNMLGNILYESGRLALALDVYRVGLARAKGLPPNYSAGARTALAMGLAASGFADEAAGEARKAIEEFREAGVTEGMTYTRALEIAAGMDCGQVVPYRPPLTETRAARFRIALDEATEVRKAGDRQRAAEMVRSAMAELPPLAEAPAEHIRGWSHLGGIHAELGDHGAAQEAYAACRDGLLAYLPRQTGDIAWATTRCAEQLLNLGRNREASETAAQAVALHVETGPSDKEDYLKALEAAVDASEACGQYALAEQHCRTLLEIMVSEGRIVDAGTAQCYRQFGAILLRQDKVREARQSLLTGCRLVHRFEGRFCKQAASMVRELALCAKARGRWGLAMALARRAVRTSAEDPVYAVLHIRAMLTIADVWTALRRLHDAAMAHEQCLMRARELLGEMHLETAVCYNNYALVAGELERHDDYERMMLRCLSIKKQLLGEDRLELSTTYANLGVCYSLIGKHEAALDFHRRAHALRCTHLSENHPDIANSEQNIAACLTRIGHLDEAESYLKSARARLSATYGRTSIHQVMLMRMFSNLFRARGDLAAEERTTWAALKLMESVHSKEAPGAAELHIDLGYLRLRQGNPEAARVALGTAFSIYQKLDGGDPQGLAKTLLAQADVAERTDAAEEEAAYLERCLLFLNEQTGSYSQAVKDRLLGLMRTRGQTERAAALLGKLLETRTNDDEGRVGLCYDLYEIRLDQGRLEECERILDQIESLLEKTEAHGSQRFSDLYLERAALKMRLRDFESAERYCRQVLDLETGQRPRVPSATLAQALRRLGDIALERDDIAASQNHYQQAISVFQAALGQDHGVIGGVLSSLALTYYRQNQFEVARALLIRALAIKERNWGALAPGLVSDLNSLALLAKMQGDFEQAETLLERSGGIVLTKFGESHQARWRQDALMAELREEQGRVEEAEARFDETLAALVALGEEADGDRADILCRYAAFCWRRKAGERACEMQAEAARIYERLLGPHHPMLASVLEDLVFLLRDSGREIETPLIESRIAVIRGK